jgi:hypothetical protein
MNNNKRLGLGFGALPNVYEEQNNARVRVWRSASERERERLCRVWKHARYFVVGFRAGTSQVLWRLWWYKEWDFSMPGD